MVLKLFMKYPTKVTKFIIKYILKFLFSSKLKIYERDYTKTETNQDYHSNTRHKNN